MNNDWSYPTNIRFGPGRVSEIAEACQGAGIRHPLWVTDPGIAALDFFDAAHTAAKRAGLGGATFTDVRGNPLVENVTAGVEAFRDGGCDGVVAFGGGSALDVGKAIAFMVAQTRSIFDFEDVGDNWTCAEVDGIAPVIAVPTTAGTGSEVGRAAVIGESGSHKKRIIFHPAMMPTCVIADPELLIALPPHITAATGMDALAHNLEAYCAPAFHPLADGIAVEGLRLLREGLEIAVHDGANLEARAATLAAASMGATAFQKGLGAIHSLSHPVGAVYDAHHGLANAVFTPYVLDYNRVAIEKRVGRLAAYLGLADASYGGLVAWILELRESIGIPHTADALGLEAERIDALAEMAAADPTAASNPRPADAAAMAGIYRASLAG